MMRTLLPSLAIAALLAGCASQPRPQAVALAEPAQVGPAPLPFDAQPLPADARPGDCLVRLGDPPNHAWARCPSQSYSDYAYSAYEAAPSYGSSYAYESGSGHSSSYVNGYGSSSGHAYGPGYSYSYGPRYAGSMYSGGVGYGSSYGMSHGYGYGYGPAYGGYAQPYRPYPLAGRDAYGYLTWPGKTPGY